MAGYCRSVRTPLLLGIVAAVGCSSSIGDPCDLDAPCGDDAVCDLSSGADPVCIDKEGDLDGDGIRNDRDFCHDRPGGRFDEDQDQVGDECDRCPIARPPATPDRDSDDVDSPCDPDPGTSGDQIVVFDGFNAELPAGWRMVGGWELLGGEAVVTPADPAQLANLVAPLPLTSTHMAVLASYRIDGVDTTATQNVVGVIAVDRRPAGTSIVQCGGSRAAGMDSLLLESDIGASAKPFTNVFDSDGLYRIAQRIDNTQGACALIADVEMGAVTANTRGEAATEGGLVAKGARARFQYLLVVQRPN